MRILWFSIVPVNFSNNSNTGGTWIESLQRIVCSWKNSDLGICYIDRYTETKHIEGSVTYYPIKIERNFFQQKWDQYTSKYFDELTLSKCVEVINDFQPDVIHVFGSEWCFGELVTMTNVPVIIHIQGCMAVINTVKRSIRYSDMDQIRERFFSPSFYVGYFLRKHRLRERVEREGRVLRNNHYFFVRTRWDSSIVKLFNPNAQLFFCNEALRSDFIHEKRKWQPHNRDKIVITTVGAALIKGVDLILKTAKLLKQNTDLNFEWRLIGGANKKLSVVSNKMKIEFADVNVISMGFLSAGQIVDSLLDSDIYIHPSYIDNSPNSICEAQYLGVPVITTYVGGIPSLFSSEYDQTMLVGVNDEYYLASKICELVHDKDAQVQLSKENMRIAYKRHSDDTISESLRYSYQAVIDDTINKNFI